VKRSRFEAAGCPSYWAVDPDEPSVTAWQLQDQAYVEVAHAVGQEQVALEAPYPVTIVPAELVS